MTNDQKATYDTVTAGAGAAVAVGVGALKGILIGWKGTANIG